MRFPKYLIQLFMMAVGLRRFGALRALDTIEEIPAWVPRLLRFFTFYIPRKLKLPDANGERLALALAAMGPAYIKLGQTLATRPDLVGASIADGLATLQDRLPAFAFSHVRASIEDAFGGKLEDHFTSFDEKAVAAASIAQVHKATTKDGSEAAVKVLRPDIEKRFTRDLALFEWLAGIAEKYSPKAKRLKPGKIVEKIRETVLQEMDLRLEGAAANELSGNMLGEEIYRIPAIVWDLTDQRVLTLEWCDGIRLSDRPALRAAGHDLPALGDTIVQTFLTQALRDGYFHADLHQGNLLVEPSGGIVAIDFGIMGRLTKLERRFLAEILYGFIKRDYRRVAELHFDAGFVPMTESLEDFTRALKAIADPILDLPIEEISAGKLLAQLFATTDKFNMQTQPQLLLLQRTMVMAEGMALHLNPQANMWKISEPVIEEWMRENLSPEVRLADLINQIPRFVERLPAFLEKMMNDPVPASAPTPVIIKQSAGIWPFAFGLIAGAAILKILVL
ncbi:MAG: 2-polyprenylphenol 6-hydroxylase [Kordiimonadaceae bacterium]|nr:2-polyprenylphenol 6-hydroxylase [Kordiimonadaceae bacterium]